MANPAKLDHSLKTTALKVLTFRRIASHLFASLVVLASAITPLAASGAETKSERDQEIRELKRRISRLEGKESRSDTSASAAASSEELTKLRLELEIPEPITKSFAGLAPGASKVYFSESPLSVGAFGEVVFSSADGGPRRTNITRLNPYLGFRFSRSLIFNSRLTFQNGGVVTGNGTPQPAAARVDFAYLDFLIDADEGQESGIRAGNFLIPVGLLNLHDEPTQFLTANRFETEQNIIPSTWHENGVMAFWRAGSVILQGGVVNSSAADRYQGETWVRAGRQNGSNAVATDFAYFARIEALTPNLNAGLSFYTGDSGQGNPTTGNASVRLAALHAEYKNDRFGAQFVAADGRLDGADRVSTANNETIASRARGAYAVLSYDVLPRVGPIASSIASKLTATGPLRPGERSLPVFVSYETVDPQAEIPAGRARDPGVKATILAIGANYKPHPQVVIKAHYNERRPDSGLLDRSLQTAIGFVF